MREILFRGKRIDNGDWVEGDLIHNDNEYYPFTFIGDLVMSRHKHTNELCIDGHCLYEVDADTVGRYIGLEDKNHKRIFENDIVMFRDYTEPAAVKWDKEEARYYVVFSDCMVDFYNVCSLKDIEVIGNIHDNPELLEGE